MESDPSWEVPERASTHPGHFGPTVSRRRRPARDYRFSGVAGGLAGGHLVDGQGAGGSFRQIQAQIEARAAAAAAAEPVTMELERRLSRRITSRSLEEVAAEEAPPPDEERELEEAAAALPSWRSTVTLRALFIGGCLGAAFSIITLKLGLTTGVIPSLNIAAGLLGFFFLGGLSKALKYVRLGGPEMTAQEVTVIQTSCVACYGLAFSGGFGTYVLAMDYQSYVNVGDVPGNRPQDVVQPQLGNLMAYMACICLVGVFMLVPLRSKMILDYELPYPSGTATGLMINSFFTKDGGDAAQRQIRSMFKWFSISFLWDFWKWFFSGNGDCGTLTGGFGSFPTFGLQAADWTWYFDFSINYVGVGMLCPQIVTWSIMFGAIISWGLMWPLISKQEGNWYPAGLSSTNLEGLYGYKVFISIAVFIVDGAYIVVKLAILSYKSVRARKAAAVARAAAGGAAPPAAPTDKAVPPSTAELGPEGVAPFDGDTALKDVSEAADMEAEADGGHHTLAGETAGERALRRHIFVKDAIPLWVALLGYAATLGIAVGVIPQIYAPAKWYYCLTAGLVAPPLAFANAYGAGLSDWNMASLYGKLAIFIFAAWAGLDAGGVIAGLAVCGVAFASIAAASDLMQDFRTGYLTLSSPRAMFLAQLTGALMGVVIAPLCFWLFWTAFPIGVPGSLYFAPYATVYRGMAIVGVEGLSVLPENCLALCGGFAGITIAMNLARDFLPHKWGRFVPLPMCMALPFYLGAWLAVDMGVGAVVMLVWQRVNPADCELLSAAVASGLIAGDGIWTIPSAILAIANVNPPICMGWAKAS